MKSFISSLITSSLLVTSIGAVDLKYSEDSSLFVFGTSAGPQIDYIGLGGLHDYQIQDGIFKFKSEFEKGYFELYFSQQSDSNRSRGDNWSLELSIPDGIETGNYEGLGRYPFEKPGFSFSGCGRCCNNFYSNVNILEAVYDDSGVLQTFAANVLQHCERASNSPTFIAVRYNSDIPVKVTTNELYGDIHEPQSFFYAINRHPINDDAQFVPYMHFDFTNSGLLPKEALDLIESEVLFTTDRVVMRTSDQKPQNKPLSHGADKSEAAFLYYPQYFGINSLLVVAIGTKDKQAIMAFSTFDGDGFYTGLQEDPSDWDYSIADEPNFIDFGPSEIYKLVEYDVREFEIDEEGNVTNLAIDYVAVGELGATSTGSIRHKSKVPVDFRNPCDP